MYLSELQTHVAQPGTCLPPMDQPLQLEIVKAGRLERGLTPHEGTARILSECSSLVEAAPRLLQVIGESFGVGWAAFWNVEHEAHVLRCLGQWRPAGIQATEFTTVSLEMTLASGQGLAGRAWQSGKPVWLPHAEPQPRYVKACTTAAARKRSSVAFPILLAGEPLAVIEMFGDASRLPNQDDMDEMMGIASQIGQFIKRKHAEEQHRTHVWFLESMDRINHAIQATDDVEQMVNGALGEMLSIFDCDRAWIYLRHPESATWTAPLERTRAGFPREFGTSADVALEPAVCQAFQTEMAGAAPMRFGPGSEWLVPAQLARRFGVRSMIAMAIGPRGGERCLFGLHQCRYPRLWTQQQERLFQEIASRLADAVSNVMMLQRLREVERKLEEAQRINHVGYWDSDLETNRMNWSDEAYRIYGLSPQESGIDLSHPLDLIHPEDREMFLETRAAALAGGTRYELEHRVVRPNGEVRIVHSQGDVTRDKSARPRRISGTVQDVTAQRTRERERKELQRQLRQAAEMTKSGRVAARELDLIIAAILHATELAQKALPEKARARRHVDEIKQAATRGKAMIERILAFACTHTSEHEAGQEQSAAENTLANCAGA